MAAMFTKPLAFADTTQANLGGRQNQPITAEVQQLLGRPPRTLEQFLSDSAWRWEQQVWT